MSKTVVLYRLFLLCGVLAGPALAVSGEVIVLDGLGRDQVAGLFRAASNETIFESLGRQRTKAWILARVAVTEVRYSAHARTRELAEAQERVLIDQVRRDFEREQQAALDARNAVILAEVERLLAEEAARDARLR